MTWYAGIDPGAKGALVALSDDLDALVYRSRLARGWAGDQERLAAWLALLDDIGGSAHLATVWVEQQHIRQGQRGQVRHVREAGMWCGWVMAYGVALEEPKAAGHAGWRVAAGMSTRASKADVLELVARRLPNLNTTPGRLRVPHMGIVDAAGIAMGARAHHRRS
tara:strand:- start:1686 stop:2180 length:495 start_codon:yes stop_codon:yes gene_type:complete